MDHLRRTRFAAKDAGLKILEQALSAMDGDVIGGELAFKLYDTYGFPIDLTADITRERGLQLDRDGFETAMQAQRQRAGAARQFGADYNQRLDVDGATAFLGYDNLACEGQVGDRGELRGAWGRFRVDDTQKRDGVFIHSGELIESELTTGDAATAQVDGARR